MIWNRKLAREFMPAHINLSEGPHLGAHKLRMLSGFIMICSAVDSSQGQDSKLVNRLIIHDCGC